MTLKQLLEIPSTKHYQGGVGRSGDREIDSCWGAGASSWMYLPLGHPSFLAGASKSKELIIPSCTMLLLGL